MGRFTAIEHDDGYWYVWDGDMRDEVARFDCADAEERAGELAGERNNATVRPAALSHGPLFDELFALRGELAAVAQRIYDDWEQDADGFDEVLGGGGPCQLIADEISSVIAEHVTAELRDGGDEEHAAVVVTDFKTEAYEVDIHHSHYERGGGYRWTKLPDVTFTADMVSITPIDMALLGDQDEDCY